MSKDGPNYTRLFDATLDEADSAENFVESVGSLGGYDLLGKIGEGGMGLIWKAREPNTGRIVALKQLRFIDAAMDSERALEAATRFDREIGLASRLEHPGIARVYETGKDEESGSPFFTMELVDGEPLTGDGCTVKEKVTLLMAVCDAVEHAHRNGIIHRDLKPANILVSSGGEVKILDFGVARALQESEIRSDLFSEDPAMTISRNGEIFGTPQFMAPEQARGESSLCDTRTDVFALGALLFRVLTGEFAHSEKGGTWEVISRVAAGDVLRPKEVLNEKLSPDLEAVLMKSLAFSPDDRYSSAGELKRDLQRYIKGEPVEAQTLTATYWLKRHIARHSTEWIAGLSFLLLVILGGIAWGVQRNRFLEEQIHLRERAEAEERGAKNAQSKSFVRIARDLRESGAKAESLPYLAQAIKLDPDSRIARASLAAAMKQFPNLRRASPTVRFMGPAKEVVFDPDCDWYAVAIHRVGMHFYDTRTQELIREIPAEGKVIDMLTVPETSGSFVVALRDFDSVARKDENSGSLLFITPAKGVVARQDTPRFVSYYDFSRDGKLMVLGFGQQADTPGAVHVVDISDFSQPEVIARHSVKLPDGMAPRVGWAADGQRVYFTNGERDGYLHRFDLESGKSVQTLITARPAGSRPYPLSQFAVASDGRIAVCGEMGHVSMWKDDVSSGPEQIWADVILDTGMIRNCRFSSDERYLSGASTRGRVYVWSAETGEQLASLDHGERILSSRFSPDPETSLLLTRSETDRYRLWNWRTGLELGHPLEGGQRILAAKFSPDGKRILLGRNNHARMWGVVPRRWDPVVLDCGDSLNAVRIDSDRNRILVTSYAGKKAMIVSIADGMILGEWPHESSYEHQRTLHQFPAELSEQGRYFATAETAKEVVVRRRGNFSEIRIPLSSTATALAFHPTAEILAIGDSASKTTIYRLDAPLDGGVARMTQVLDGSGIHPWEFYKNKKEQGVSDLPLRNFVSHVSFAPIGERLVALESPRAVYSLYDWKKGAAIGMPVAAGAPILDMKITPDGKFFVMGGEALFARITRLADGTSFGPSRHHSAAIRKIEVDVDSKRFVSGSADGQVKFWNVEASGENEPVVIPPQEAPVISLALSKDGILCASGDAHGRVKIWLMETGESLCDPLEAGSAVNDLAFHDKYPLLVAACEDGKIRMWEIPSGKGRCATEFATLAETMAGLFLTEEGQPKVGAIYQYDQMRERFYTRYKEQVREREVNSGYRPDEYHRLANEIFGFPPIEEPDWILRDD